MGSPLYVVFLSFPFFYCSPPSHVTRGKLSLTHSRTIKLFYSFSSVFFFLFFPARRFTRGDIHSYISESGFRVLILRVFMNFIDYSQLEINKIRIEGGRRDFVCLRSFHRNGVGNGWWDLRKGEILKNVRASVSRLFEAKHCVYPRLLSGGGTGSRLRYNVESGPPFPRNRLLSPRVGRRVERKVLCEPRCSSTRYTAAIRTFLADKKARLPTSCCTQPKGG